MKCKRFLFRDGISKTLYKRIRDKLILQVSMYSDNLYLDNLYSGNPHTYVPRGSKIPIKYIEC